MKLKIALTLIVAFQNVCFAQKIDQKLQKQLSDLVKDFNGDVGIYVHHLKKNKVAAINADSLFPTASMIKVPIMCGVFNEIDKGNLKFHQDLTYRDSLLYAGVDILGSFKDGEKISLSKVQMLSITTSDNTASVWLQKIVGGEKINQWLNDNGFNATRVNSRTQGRTDFYKKYGWGMTSPKEMARLFTMIHQGKAISEAASEIMYRNLTRIYWNEEALSEIPPFVQVASKQGAVNASKSETLLVNAPHGDYVFSVITKNQKDQRWVADNEGYVLLRKVSALLWNYFEPQSDWKPSSGIDKYRE